MGVKGLWNILKPAGQPIDLESLRGKILAVDISFWLHHAKYVSELKGISEYKAAIELVYRRVLKLLHFGVRPIFVFDGPEASIFKLPALNERRRQRDRQKSEKTRRSRNNTIKTLAIKALAYQLARDEGKRQAQRNPSGSSCESSDDGEEEEEQDAPCSSVSSTQKDEVITISDEDEDEEKNDVDDLPWLLHHFDPSEEKQKSVKVIFGSADQAHVLVRSDTGSGETTDQQGGFLDNGRRKREAVERIRRQAVLEHVKSLRQDQQKRYAMVSSQLLVHEDEKSIMSSDGELEEVPDVDASSLFTSIRERPVPRSPGPVIEEGEASDQSAKYTVEKWNGQEEPDKTTSAGGEIVERCRELLTFFGVPCVDSPAEAEAQCVCLEQAGFTDGTITDDSDVWAFGGRVVYRHVFERKKSALEFKADDIADAFGLEHIHFVALAMIMGCDFTPGASNVGAVASLEIVSSFMSNGKDALTAERLVKQLVKFRRWWEKNHVQDGKADAPETDATKRRLRKLNIIFPSSFPDRHVAELFTKPKVKQIDQSNKPPFQWSRPDMKNLRRLLAEELDDLKHVDVELADLQRRLKPPDPSQSKIISHFTRVKRKPTGSEILECTTSKRFKKACERLKNSS